MSNGPADVRCREKDVSGADVKEVFAGKVEGDGVSGLGTEDTFRSAGCTTGARSS
jgi:hypothetical protein